MAKVLVMVQCFVAILPVPSLQLLLDRAGVLL